eukprot:TCONS_00022387-protein
MDRFVGRLVLIIIIITCVQGDIFSNFLNFITHSPYQAHDEEIARRFKRITPEDDYVDSYHEEKNKLDHKRSVEEEELEEILHHASTKATRRSADDENSDILSTRSKTGSVVLEKSAVLKENAIGEGGNQVKADSQVDIVSAYPKFQKINSREEKEMSSIKTLSSFSFPAEKKSGNQDGSGSSDDEESAPNEVVNWPKGRYGLPKPVTGCPTSDKTRWKTGFRYHDTEDDGTENQRSDNFHLAANFSEDGISHEFCIKDDFEGEGEWPAGRYCIYKRGPLCPQGLDQGFVIWDDENTDNQDDKGGALPEGEYTEDTKIYFCCSDKGIKDNQIALPTKKPFFLFAYKSINCQKVQNMRATSEFIKWDDEDRGNADYEEGAYPFGIHRFQKDHMLFLCYYEPNKPAVTAYNSAEPSTGTNLEEDMGGQGGPGGGGEMDQESLRQSEEMMKAFMKATGGVEDETNKKERTKAIIKTIQVPVHAKSSPMATIFGLIVGSFVIGTAIIILAKHVNRRPPPPKQNKNNNGKTLLNHTVDATWPDSAHRGKFQALKTNDDVEDVVYEACECGQSVYTQEREESESEASYYTDKEDSWSDLEVDDELVEDQLLPDSELKSGLELLFLKQQRHYWNQTRRHNQSRESNDK